MMFRMKLKELMNLKQRTNEQQDLLNEYYSELPIIDSDSVMNKICHNIESEVEKMNKPRLSLNDEVWHIYMNGDIEFDEVKYEKLKVKLNRLLDMWSDDVVMRYTELKPVKYGRKVHVNTSLLVDSWWNITTNREEAVNYLVKYFYDYKKSHTKKMLWDTFGEDIFKNVVKNSKDGINVYVEDKDGDIKYLGKSYRREIVCESI